MQPAPNRNDGRGCKNTKTGIGGRVAMPVHNTDIAEIFNRMAEILEMEDANPFRVRAYRNAARTVGPRFRFEPALLAKFVYWR